MSQCLITSVHGLLLAKIDNSSSEKFLQAVYQSGCEERLYEAKPQVVMRWLTSFWTHACKDHVKVNDTVYESLYNASSYKKWLVAFEATFVKAIKEHSLPKKIPSMPAFHTFE